MKHVFSSLLRAVFIAILALTMVAVNNRPSADAASGCSFDFTKTADKDSVAPGDEIIYTLRLKNIGTSNCTGGGVELVEYYDAQTTFDSASISPTSGHSVWNFGTIVPGQEYHFWVKVRVNSNAQPGDITNRACVWAEQFGPSSDPSSWRCVTATSILPGVTLSATGGGNAGPNNANRPKILLSKKAHQTVAYPGQTIEYTLTVQSVGTKDADDVSVEDTLPTGFTFTDGGGTTKSWFLGNIRTGSQKTVTYSVVVAPSATVGEYENIAIATMKDGFAPDNRSEARASVSVHDPASSLNVAKIALDKTTAVSRTLAGDLLQYSLTVKNVGATKAVSVTVRDVLPSGFVFRDFSSSEHTFVIGDLDSGEERIITYEVSTLKTLPSGVYRNIAVAQAANTSAVTDESEVYVENPRLGLTALPKTGVSGLGLAAAVAGFVFAVLLTVVVIRGRFSSSDRSLDVT